MNKQAVQQIKQQCGSCAGTGLYSGFAEPKGTAVICGTCQGRGWHWHKYLEFEGRKRKAGIKAVQASAGRFLATGVGGVGKTMTYAEFEAAVSAGDFEAT